MRIKVVIIDDEKDAIASLQLVLDKFIDEVQVIGTATSVKAGIALIQEKRPELVFLDIRMHGGSGFNILEKIEDISFHIIFVTAYEQYAIKAIKFSALDYLLKPVDVDELASAVNKVKEQPYPSFNQASYSLLKENLDKRQPEKIILKATTGFNVLHIRDIVRCEAHGNYTHFYLLDGTNYFISRNLKEYEQMLPEADFFRIHNSHLIHLKHVKDYSNIDKAYVMMADGKKVPVAVRKKSAFLRIIKSLQ